MQIAQRLANTNYNTAGIHLANVPMLLRVCEDVDMDSMIDAIRSFTSFNVFKQLFYHRQGFRLQKVNSDKYRISFQEKSMEFSKFSHLLFCRSIRTRIWLKFQLCTDLRKGACHYYSLRFLPSFGGSVVTGYVKDSSRKFRVVHSFIETENGNVIDYTSNLVTSKENYYRLFDPIIIDRVTKDQFLNDVASNQLNGAVGDKFYCLFHGELLNGHSFMRGNEWEVQGTSKQKVLH